MSRIFSITELEAIAASLVPAAVMDRHSLMFCVETQLRPMTRTADGRAELAGRIARLQGVRGNERRSDMGAVRMDCQADR